jgi:hypothetical protein
MQFGKFIQQARVPNSVKVLFDIQENRSLRHIVIEMHGHMARKPHTPKCRAVTCTKAKLTCTFQVLIFNVPLGYFYNRFRTEFNRHGQKAYGAKILREFLLLIWCP